MSHFIKSICGNMAYCKGLEEDGPAAPQQAKRPWQKKREAVR